MGIVNKYLMAFNSGFDALRIKHWSLVLFGWILAAMLMIYFMIPPVSISNPLYYPSDTSVFFMMGEYWLEGMQPGRDLFDHKGPLLYAIFAFGSWLIPGKAGLFLLLSISLGVSFYFLFRLSRLFLSRFEATIATVAYIAICASAFMGGTEDFSLPFVVAPLYYFIRYLHQSERDPSIPWPVWIFSGISFGAIVMLRPNNAGVLCAIIIYIGCRMLYKKQFSALLKAAVLFLAGSILSILPMLLFLHLNGVLADCLYAGYTFNMTFATNGIAEKSPADWLAIVKYSASLWLVLPFGFILYMRQHLCGRMYAAMLAVSIISALFLIPGKNYAHYFILYSPCVVFALICAILTIKNATSKKGIILVGLATLLVYASSVGFSLIILRYGLYGVLCPEKHAKHLAEQNVYRASQNMRKLIPADELNQVLHYDGQGNVYLYMQAKPPTRYFMLQEFLLNQVPAIRETVERDIVRSKPAWIIIRDYQLYSCTNKPLLNYLRRECEPVKFQEEKSDFLLFKRTGPK